MRRQLVPNKLCKEFSVASHMMLLLLLLLFPMQWPSYTAAQNLDELVVPEFPRYPNFTPRRKKPWVPSRDNPLRGALHGKFNICGDQVYGILFLDEMGAVTGLSIHFPTGDGNYVNFHNFDHYPPVGGPGGYSEIETPNGREERDMYRTRMDTLRTPARSPFEAQFDDIFGGRGGISDAGLTLEEALSSKRQSLVYKLSPKTGRCNPCDSADILNRHRVGPTLRSRSNISGRMAVIAPALSLPAYEGRLWAGDAAPTLAVLEEAAKTPELMVEAGTAVADRMAHVYKTTQTERATGYQKFLMSIGCKDMYHFSKNNGKLYVAGSYGYYWSFLSDDVVWEGWSLNPRP